MNDDVFPEPLGPEYAEPRQENCPDCPCCSKRLCARGRASLHGCTGLVRSDELRQITANCPCAAESTEGTLLWHCARVRAVLHAENRPLTVDVEDMLKTIGAGRKVYDPSGLMPQLTFRRFVAFENNRPVVTEFGRLYLAARIEERRLSPIIVHSVNQPARTCQVVVVGWRADEPVTLPMDQLIAATRVTPGELPGTVVQGFANCGAASARDLVVSRVSAVLRPVPAARSAGTTTGLLAGRAGERP